MDKSDIIYRLRNGILHFSEGVELNFVTGFIYENQGDYIIEIHFHPETDLEKFYYNNDAIFHKYFSIRCFTSDGSKCIINDVLIASGKFPTQELWGNFKTYDKIIIEKQEKYLDRENSKEQTENDGSIKYLSVKYLNIRHSIYPQSYNEFERFGEKIKEPYFDKEKAHTPVEFTYKGNKYGFHIKDDKKIKGDFIIDFHLDKKDYSSLKYKDWLDIKLDFISFLSFFNGADVIIKNEYYGHSYQLSNVNSSKINYYSFDDKLLKPNKWSDFFLLKNSGYNGCNYLQKAFDKFSDYIELNKKIDLNTIIWYLNLSCRNISIEERIFIQTITLERLSKYYFESQEIKKHKALINEEIFDKIKKEMFATLDKYKNQISDKEYKDLKSKIGEVNQINRKETFEKFKYLIESVNIPLSSEITELLRDRNDIIHSGDIGDDEKGVKKYFLMDELIRGIIAKLIGYKGDVKKGKIAWV